MKRTRKAPKRRSPSKGVAAARRARKAHSVAFKEGRLAFKTGCGVHANSYFDHHERVDWYSGFIVERGEVMAKFIDMGIAARLKSARNEVGLTRRGVMLAVGIPDSSIEKYECGTMDPNLQRLVILCELYGVSVNEIIFGVDHTAAPPAPDTTPRGLALAKRFNDVGKRYAAAADTIVRDQEVAGELVFSTLIDHENRIDEIEEAIRSAIASVQADREV